MSDEPELPVAGTVVLLRDAPHGIETLLMRRPDRGSFAGAWVFPGGRTEEVDRRPGASEREDAARAAIREAREEVGLDVENPVPLSLWEPPIQVPTRIRTWFFLAEARRQELRLSPAEVVDARWERPEAALERHAAGEWTLFPPTWMTLHGLLGRTDVRAALADAVGPRPVFRTRVLDSPSGRSFHWGDVSLETGSLPWRVQHRRQAQPLGDAPNASGPSRIPG